MIYLIDSPSTDPHFNLALEQYVFDHLDRAHTYFMLWQNDNTIVVGKHQNTFAEINVPYVREHGIHIVRRLSGGGAVYHDLGNLNFTFISDLRGGGSFDFSAFCQPVVKALAQMGVPAEINGRNDMTIDGKKFSGSAQYIRQGRIMHHGTLMYSSDLSRVAAALHVSEDKYESKGLKSVRSRITNIMDYLPEPLPISAFKQALLRRMFEGREPERYRLEENDRTAILRIQSEVYDRWEWNFGASPAYALVKKRRLEDVGGIEVHMNVSEGMIQAMEFYGDYFGIGDGKELAGLLTGHRMEENELRGVLSQIDVSHYFAHLSREAFLSILLQ